MFLSDDDSAKLKQWIVNRLEDMYVSFTLRFSFLASSCAHGVPANSCDSSDADSDVLADYVLALVKAEEPDDQVRANCLENLEDFLQERASPIALPSLES